MIDSNSVRVILKTTINRKDYKVTIAKMYGLSYKGSEKVYTTYTVFELEGKKYVQFDTYGRLDRENPEKISQSIQLDKETAQFIVKLLVSEFMS